MKGSGAIRRSILALAVFAMVWAGLVHGVRAVPAVAAESRRQPLSAVAPLGAQIPERLSNERTYTRWAHPSVVAPIRAAPSPGAPLVGRLHLLTEEGEPEVYLLLSKLSSSSGVTWVQLRIPGRPNGRVGWVASDDLGAIHLTHWALRVNLSLLRTTLFYDGRARWSAPIGVGEPSTPTPTGHFWVRELLRVPGHTLYGPFAFGTSDYSVLSDWPRGGVVGIHGTNQAELIPGRPSHGCVRLHNPDITYLAHHLAIGAPVDVVA